MADFWGGVSPSDHLRYRLARSAMGQPPWVGTGYTEEEYNALSPEQRQQVDDARRAQQDTQARAYQEGVGGLPGSYAWTELERDMPSVSDLSVEYGQEAEVGGYDPMTGLAGASADGSSITAQHRALEDMQRLARDGGMSAGDRARMEIGRQQVGQAMRGQREADEASLQARGMGGSGSMLASMMGAQQSGATALSQRDAAIQAEASQRAMQALMASGQMAGQIRGQSFDESATRGGGMDAYHRWQSEYQRDRERFNTQQRDRSAESRAGAQQQYFGNRAATAAGREGNAQAQVAVQQAEQDRTDRRIGAGAQLAGSLFG